MPPKHEPTDLTRQTVQLHTSAGTPQALLARLLGIDEKTLRLHYRDELDLSMVKANAVIAGVLFAKAKAGDTASVFFWLKTRAGWRETQHLEHTGKDGGAINLQTLDPTKLSADTLRELLAARNATPEPDAS